MACHHNQRTYGRFTSSMTNGIYQSDSYWVCKHCGLVHVTSADMTYICRYFPDRFLAVYDRLRSSTAPEISDIWTGKYPQEESA